MSANDATTATEQLRMVATEVISVQSWKLDQATIDRGMRGLAKVRAALAEARERAAEVDDHRQAA